MRVIEYNELPESARARFVALTRTKGAQGLVHRQLTMFDSDAPSLLMTLLFSAGILLGGGVAFAQFTHGFGERYGYWINTTQFIVVAVGLGVAALCTLGLIRNLKKKRMPYQPGLYILPNEIVDANGNGVLVATPLANCEVKVVALYVNGRFSGHHLKVDGYQFALTSEAEGQKIAADIIRCQRADSESLQRFDPFSPASTLPMSSSGAPLAQKSWSWTKFILPATFAAVCLAYPLGVIRNRLSEDAHFEMLQETPDRQLLEDYVRRPGTAHDDEARALLRRIDGVE